MKLSFINNINNCVLDAFAFGISAGSGIVVSIWDKWVCAEARIKRISSGFTAREQDKCVLSTVKKRVCQKILRSNFNHFMSTKSHLLHKFRPGCELHICVTKAGNVP